MQNDAPTTGEIVAELRALLAKATPGPWQYRPEEYDDWGFIRGGERGEFGFPMVAVGRGSHDDHDEHRRNGTDPYGPNSELIVAAVNALPTLLNALETQGAHDAAVIEALDEHSDRVAVDTLSAAMKECRRVRSETQFSVDVPEGERQALRNGAEACWVMLNAMQGEILKRHGIRLPERIGTAALHPAPAALKSPDHILDPVEGKGEHPAS